MATHSDEEDMPLAKRQRRLFQQRGMHSKLQELPDTGKTVSPDPSDVIIILDDSDDGSAPAPAPPPEPSHSDPPPRSESPKQPGWKLSDISTAEEDGTPPIEQQAAEIEEIQLCTTSEDEQIEPEVEEVEQERKRKREPPISSRLNFAPQAPQNFRQTARHSPPVPPQPIPRRQSPPPFLNHSNHPPAASLDAPYEFSSYDVASEFRRKFTRAPRASPGLSKSAVERRAKQILDDMTQPTRQAMQKTQTAWKQAAMRWREKNKPTAADLKKRQEEEAARISEAARIRAKNTPATWAATDKAKAAGEQGGASTSGVNGKHPGLIGNVEPPPIRPRASAPESEWRSYYRNVAQHKIGPAASFVQVLRIFGIPCDDPSKIKDAYRIAVRMYHPDSNSKDRAWKTPQEKVQAEEVMKIINEKKEREM